jgi:hypothetical protein
MQKFITILEVLGIVFPQAAIVAKGIAAIADKHPQVKADLDALLAEANAANDETITKAEKWLKENPAQ